MEGLKNWFKGRFSQVKSQPPPRASNTGTYRQRLAAAEKAVDHPSQDPGVEIDPPQGRMKAWVQVKTYSFATPTFAKTWAPMNP